MSSVSEKSYHMKPRFSRHRCDKCLTLWKPKNNQSKIRAFYIIFHGFLLSKFGKKTVRE